MSQPVHLQDEDVTLLSRDGSKAVVPFSEFRDRILSGALNEEDIVVGPTITNGEPRRAGDLSLFKVLRYGAWPTIQGMPPSRDLLISDDRARLGGGPDLWNRKPLSDVCRAMRWAQYMLGFLFFGSCGVLLLIVQPTMRLPPVVWFYPFLLFFLPMGIVTHVLSLQGYKRRGTKNVSQESFIKPQWKSLIAAMVEAGINPYDTPIYYFWSSGWDIRVFTRPRIHWATYILLLIVMIAVSVSEIFTRVNTTSRGFALSLLLLSLISVITSLWVLYLTLLDVFRSRTSIAISPAVIRALRASPEQATIVFAHEMAHIRHGDTMNRLLWKLRAWMAAFAMSTFSILLIYYSFMNIIDRIRWLSPFYGERISSQIPLIILPFLTLTAWICGTLAVNRTFRVIYGMQEFNADLEASDNLTRRNMLLSALRQLRQDSTDASPKAGLSGWLSRYRILSPILCTFLFLLIYGTLSILSSHDSFHIPMNFLLLPIPIFIISFYCSMIVNDSESGNVILKNRIELLESGDFRRIRRQIMFKPVLCFALYFVLLTIGFFLVYSIYF